MKALFTAATAAVVAAMALAACTVHQTETPPVSGPSDLALSVRLQAIPDSIGQDGGSQSSIKVFANGPDGKPINGLPIRIDMAVVTSRGLVVQDFGGLSARSIVTGSDGVANVVYTAPPASPSGVTGTCNGLPGTCVSIIATPTATNFGTVAPQSVTIRLVPLGVILPPPGTPTPCFTFSPAQPGANTPVQFTAGTLVSGVCQPPTPDITTFSWAFGDGGTASGPQVTHTFGAGNSFSVTLTETNDRGISASTTQTVTVTAAQLPTALFIFSPAAPGVNETVFFNASTSTAGPGHTIASYSWDFGDGSKGSGVAPSHAYAVTGTYTVVLTVKDESGQSSSASQTVGVGLQTPAPSASFTFSPATPAVNQTVTFDASRSTTAQGQTIKFYDWTFGDGSVPQRTTTPVVGHQYGIAGTFSVNLVVTDSANRTGSISTPITVAGALACPDATLPCGQIESTPAPSKVNQETSFTARVFSPGTGATTVTNFMWDFGDGTPLFGTNVPTVGYTYRRTGTFIVKLTMTNNIGRQSSTTTTINVQ